MAIQLSGLDSDVFNSKVHPLKWVHQQFTNIVITWLDIISRSILLCSPYIFSNLDPSCVPCAMLSSGYRQIQ